MGAVLPRSFRLLEELEKGEKGIQSPLHLFFLNIKNCLGLGDGSCSYGLADGDDIMMTNWNGTILGPPHVLSRFRGLDSLTCIFRVLMRTEFTA